MGYEKFAEKHAWDWDSAYEAVCRRTGASPELGLDQDDDEDAEEAQTGEGDEKSDGDKKVAKITVGLKVQNMTTKRIGSVVEVTGSKPDHFVVKFDDNGEEGERPIAKFAAEDGRELEK